MQLTWSRKHYSVALAIVGLLLTITLLLLLPFKQPWPKVLECVLYLYCLLLLASYEPVRALFAAIPKTQQRALLGLVVILFVAQIKDRPQQTFPFLPWNMYHGRFREPLQYLEFVGVCPDGHEVVINAGKVFASQQRTVLWHLQDLSKQMETAKNEAAQQLYAEQFQSYLVAMVKRFNDQHPGTDVTRVRAIQCTIPRPAPGLKLETIRQLLKEYPLS